MSRGMGSDFEMIEGKGIQTVRNKNQAKRGKNLKFRLKEKEKRKEKENEEK